jgi:anthranilate phosphoribosyltransferase
MIAKSASYATSGITGSRDILEDVGINLTIPIFKMMEALQKYGIAFFPIENQIPKFDEAYGGKFFFIHPLSYILPALILPVQADSILYGIADPNTELTAKLLRKYNFDNSMVVCGMNRFENKFIDEISIIGPTKITEIRNTRIRTYIFRPGQIDLKIAKKKEIININEKENRLTFLRVLSNLDNSVKSQMAYLNSAALLYISGNCASIKEGYSLSKELTESGKPLSTLQLLIEFTGGNKKKIQNVID